MSPRTLSRFLIIYMVFAFGWWAVHLWRSNDELFKLETRVLEDNYRERGVNLTALQQTKEYTAAHKKWRKRRRMILSEGIFFTACLIAGLWIVNRSTNREVSLARQRRNFLLSITHELKSPIAGMRLVLQTLGKYELNKEQREKLCSNGVSDASRLQNLVDDLLLAARLEDKWQAFPEPVDLRTLANEIASNLKVRFPQANIRIEMPDDLLPVQADKPGLTAVVQNLLENAVKYSPQPPRSFLPQSNEMENSVFASPIRASAFLPPKKKLFLKNFTVSAMKKHGKPQAQDWVYSS